MKKFYICLILIITVLGTACVSNAAQFYDTLNTKYESPTEILHMLGIIDGVSENVFSPKRVVTRAEMAKLLLCTYNIDEWMNGLASGQNKFKDVKKSDWFYDYVEVAADAGIINGYDDGTFKPNKEVSYGEACTMIVRALGYGIINPPAGQSWDQGYVNKAVSLKITKNVGAFKNNDGAIRGNIAIMIWNMLNADTYMVVKEKTNVGIIKESISRKVIKTYYPDYYIIDDEIISDIYTLKVEDEESTNSKNSTPKYRYKYFVTLENLGDVELNEPVALKNLGAKVSGIYNVKTKEITGLNIVYDEDFDDGIVSELEDYYKLNKKSSTYSFGNDKTYVYVYLKNDGTVDRMAFLGSNYDIIVEGSKISKEKDQPEYITINEEYMINTDNVLIDAEGKVYSWASVKAENVISRLSNGMYVLSANKISGEITDIIDKKDRLQIKVGGVLYECDEEATYTDFGNKTKKSATYKNLKNCIGRKVDLTVNYAGKVLAIDLNRNYENATASNRFGIILNISESNSRKYIEIQNVSGRKRYNIPDDMKTNFNVGTLVNFEADGSTIKFIDVLKTNLKLGDEKVVMDLESKDYENDVFAGYDIADTTVIYMIEETYVMNSDKDIESYNIVINDNTDVLKTVEDKPVHIIYTPGNNELVAIFIEEAVNRFDYKYARVLDIYTEKDKDKKTSTVKIRLSPFNTVVTNYEVSGILKCEIGDIISYQSDGEKIVIKETYSTNALGDSKDLIVEKVSDKKVYCTNGDVIDFSKDAFEANDKKYNFGDYYIVMAKVSNLYDTWKFVSTELVKKNDASFGKGDRIAIDEIEDLIIIYRGYED